ncbi:serine/threonine protein kinase [Nitzschia inconspicua]|uniref:non-specific serine/threonine protein kinase n=1 Tax=Nitzschia inconspicua TaxID=303405 RepID=A0A9K3Q1C7_9STRA|nr:serine/threonine protein kinase [Nitzschia inconspicua]
MPGAEGGLGSALVGEKISMGQTQLQVTKLLGEGGFSYVYLVKELGEGGLTSSLHINAPKHGNGTEESAASTTGSTDAPPPGPQGPLVLKVTSIHSRAQRDIAEKEAKLLSRLSHPSIIRMYDTCYRTPAQQPSGKRGKENPNSAKERPQHLILMEYCEGGHALDVCNKLAATGQRFDLSTLIIAFGQICNAVSYLHAQRPPIVHRDLKPVNFLVKNGAYKLCDFGSAVFGHVDLRTSKARADAEEVIEKTTTQMFRAPEMVDLYSAKKLTQATDVWALGCCLYSLAFLQNCFEEGSNLAILSRKYTIPDDNPYGDGLVELLDRMLTVDPKARADMTEVILCLSAVYSGRPLPPRKKPSKSSSKSEAKEEGNNKEPDSKKEAASDDRAGKFRTDSQGYQENIYDPTKVTEGKKLASNSVAARRKRAATAASPAKPPAPAHAPAPATKPSEVEDPLAFSALQETEDATTTDVAFSSDFDSMKAFENSKTEDFFGSFDAQPVQSAAAGGDGFDAAALSSAWGDVVPSSEITSGGEDGQAEDFDGAGFDSLDGESDSKKKDDTDQRKSSRRRQQGSRTSRSGSSRVEAGVEAMNISDQDNSDAERRRGEDPRKRSSSKSRRKARERGSKTDESEEGKKGSSFRNPFNRKQAPSEP